MTIIAACALPDTDCDEADPIRALATLAARAMCVARRAVEQYEALTSQQAPQPEPATAREQPDPGILFTRAARVVLNCITKECRLRAGLPLAPARPRAIPRADASTRNDVAAAPLRQARPAVTRNHPQGEEIPRQGQEQGLAARAAPDHPIGTQALLQRVCAAAGIRLNRARRRSLARDLIFDSLPVEAPVPS
ncbi:MAG TPA: hypothetical protein VMB71_07650 [Acetobacteraceae bacterium]|nr:hypothetical protein [Acetobacteraceae bacterium]